MGSSRHYGPEPPFAPDRTADVPLARFRSEVRREALRDVIDGSPCGGDLEVLNRWIVDRRVVVVVALVTRLNVRLLSPNMHQAWRFRTLKYTLYT